ncbi:MAG: hypothetical protein JSW53_00510 [Candidatus Bathyarchaeota archaeon]|nr:MAG: hypothetical protein JSW53_00510 [Candidatus Bathyarchaeota archaeon]
MPERKRKKRGIFDLFGFSEEDLLFGREPVEGGSGYSISVTSHEGGQPVVRGKTRGAVDAAKLRSDVEQRYPGAKIEGLEKKPLIRVVDEDGEESGEEKSETRGKIG